MSLIYGKNPVLEVLKAGKTINKIYIQKSNELKEIIDIAQQKNVVMINQKKVNLDKMIDNKNSQGVVADISNYNYFDIDDILEFAESKNQKPVVVVLDKIEDPHNLGAIIRSVECLGAHGVIIPKRNACQVNDTVEKVSAGALEYVKIARVTNITESIKYLKQKGLWVYGLDMDGAKNIYDEKFDAGVAIVIGNEGYGISRLVKQNCDMLVKIPMTGKINSLNASVSTAIALYEVTRQKMQSKEE